MIFNTCQAVSVFKRILFASVPEVWEKDGATGKCGQVSLSFLRFLSEIGIEALNVQLLKDDEPHVVTIAGHHFYDWTHRQYDPEAAIPTIGTVEALLAEGWQIIGQQLPGEIKPEVAGE